MTIFKPKSTDEVLSLMADSPSDWPVEPSLTDRPAEPEPEPERGPDELYALLSPLMAEGYEFRIGGTGADPKVKVHPPLDLAPEELALMREHKAHVITWVREIAALREPRRRLKAGVRRWLDDDVEDREWVLGFWDRPEQGQGYVRGELWYVASVLRELGLEVRDAETRALLSLVVVEVAAEIATEERAA